MATNDAWLEKCLISIAAQGGSDVKFQGLTSSVDIDFGIKDINQIDLIGGSCTVEHIPMSITSITLEAYPVDVATINFDSAGNAAGFFDLLQGTVCTSLPLTITGFKDSMKVRIAALWTDDTTITNAASATTSSVAAFRLAFADGFVTAVKPSFTDGILKFTITIKIIAHDNSGNSNIKLESVSTSSNLSALASYTSSTKW